MSVPVHLDTPSALNFFAALMGEDSAVPVLEAAIAVAQDECPGLDVQGVLDEVDVLGARLRRRLPPDASAMQRLRLLNPYFFQELGFAGNVDNYYDPGNSLVPVVLQTRRGIPLTLALVYIELAGQIGLEAHGVAFPGHFLVKLALPQGEVVIDPFNGQSLTREDLEGRLALFRRQFGEAGGAAPPLAACLQPASAREIIARLLRNLLEIYRGKDDLQRLATVLRRLLIVQPQAGAARRDLALVLARLGHHEAAARELETFLQNRPDARDARQLRFELDRRRRAH